MVNRMHIAARLPPVGVVYMRNIYGINNAMHPYIIARNRFNFFIM